jgi:hypothetical protein
MKMCTISESLYILAREEKIATRLLAVVAYNFMAFINMLPVAEFPLTDIDD